MTAIIDPRTGQPAAPQVSQQQILMAIEILGQKTDAIAVDQFHTAIATQWLFQRIQDHTDEHGAPIIDLKLDDFEPWAQARWEEMRKQAEEAMNNPKLAEEVNKLAEDIGVNLNE